MPASKQQLHTAQKLCTEHGIKELFAEYNLKRILHWNDEMQYYELRARPPNPYWIEKHVAPLAFFVEWSEKEQRQKLQTIHNQIYQKGM